MKEKGTKRILYMMICDWNWIYQRPHIIAQHLQENYDVTVVFPRSILMWRPFHKADLDSYPVDCRILWDIPLQERNRLVGMLSSWINRRIFKDIYQFQCVWVGYPLHRRHIPDDYQGGIIYDCMDNYEIVYGYAKKVSKKLIEQERILAGTCDALFVSGKNLECKMKRLVKEAYEKIVLVRNGTDVDNLTLPHSVPIKPGTRYKIGYFGTIAEWFDFDLLLTSLEKIPSIEYHLIGPLIGNKNKSHQRMILEGAVEHKELREMTRDYACMIMPFVVNDVVKWVDPVKLYEYIAFGKCIVSVYYDEIERFRDFVYFYKDMEEYVSLLEWLVREGFPPKYTAEQQESFVQENSWPSRLKVIDGVLDELV